MHVKFVDPNTASLGSFESDVVPCVDWDEAQLPLSTLTNWIKAELKQPYDGLPPCICVLVDELKSAPTSVIETIAEAGGYIIERPVGFAGLDRHGRKKAIADVLLPEDADLSLNSGDADSLDQAQSEDQLTSDTSADSRAAYANPPYGVSEADFKRYVLDLPNE